MLLLQLRIDIRRSSCRPGAELGGRSLYCATTLLVVRRTVRALLRRWRIDRGGARIHVVILLLLNVAIVLLLDIAVVELALAVG